MFKTSEKLDKIIPALLGAQASIRPIALDGTNPHFRSRYATLGAVLSAVLPVLRDFETVLLQSAFGDPGDNMVGVTTRLIHISGQWVETTLAAPEVAATRGGKSDAHALGSIITYLRRYSLVTLLAIPTGCVDDDGNTSVGTPRAAPRGSGSPARVPIMNSQQMKAALAELAPPTIVSLYDVTLWLKSRNRSAPMELTRTKQEELLNFLKTTRGMKMVKEHKAARAMKLVAAAVPGLTEDVS